MAQTTQKTINVPLTKSQISNLIEFIDYEFIESIRRDEDIDNIDYIVDMANALQTLRSCVPEPVNSDRYVEQEKT